MKNLTIEKIKNVLTEKMKVEELANSLGVSKNVLIYIFTTNGTGLTQLKKEKFPQLYDETTPQRQGVIRHKYFRKYSRATSAGIKAGIAREYHKICGGEIKQDILTMFKPISKVLMQKTEVETPQDLHDRIEELQKQLKKNAIESDVRILALEKAIAKLLKKK